MDFLVAYATWMGACTASLLGVVADRGSWSRARTGRSACVCGRPVGPVALVPVAGWLLFGGRARCCGATIPARYPATELALALTWGGAAWAAGGHGWVGVAGWVLIAAVSSTLVLRVLRRRRAPVAA